LTGFTNARDLRRIARTFGLILVLAAPGIAYGNWYSTRQPLEILALANKARPGLPPENYASAVYMGANAQRTLDDMWTPTGFATLSTIAFLTGLTLLYFGFRRKGQITV
jgi:hypothetical protein